MSISQRFGRSTAWIVDRPVWAYLILILISTIATIGYIDPERVRSLFLPRPAPALAETPAPAEKTTPSSAGVQQVPKPRPQVEALDLTRSDAILVIESDDIFTTAGAQALRRMVETLESLPYVRNVLWMDRVPVLNIFGLREPLFPKSQASPARFSAAREHALANPLVKGQLLSADGRTLIVLVNL